MYLMTATRNGVSAKELGRQLGVTYKWAWRIGHQLRLLMSARDKANSPGQMKGHVEADETFIGGRKKGRMGKGAYLQNKTVVAGIVQRGGMVKGKVVPDDKVTSLIPNILKNVESGATISTDTHASYRRLTRLGFNHGTVNHDAEEWVNGIHHVTRL